MHHSLVRALRARGADVLTALEAGMIEREDADHLAYATQQGRVLCTFNIGDYYGLHTDWATQGRRHAGVVLMPQQHYSVGEQMRRLFRLMAHRGSDEMENRVEFLSEWG
jgi:hypothetical protein